MPANEWYKRWFNSPYYHKLYFERDDIEAKKIVDALISYLKPPVESRIVDIACGRGRHSKMLAAHGFDVTGFDLSFDNISYADQFSHEKLHFYQHDMRLPFWINYFNYAFNFFTSFGYFATRREHDDAIRTIAGSLKPQGYLIVDYLNVHFAEDHLVHNETRTIGNTDYEIHRWHDDDHFYKKIIITDPDLEQPLTFTEKIGKLTLGDFTDMLSFQKMQVTEVFGNYSLGAYDVRKTPRMIIIARKT